MASLKTLAAAAACLAVGANAATHTVTVGQGGLVFSPNTITADKGDTIVFNFVAGNHSVAYGDFSNACNPAKSGGFFSGYFPKPGTFTVTLDDDDATAFYCTQSFNNHCKAGMVGVINPSGSQTLDAYMAAARAATANVAPGSVFGGTVGGAGATSAPAATATSSDDHGHDGRTTTKTGDDNSGTTRTTATSAGAATTTTSSGSSSGTSSGGSSRSSSTSTTSAAGATTTAGAGAMAVPVGAVLGVVAGVVALL